MQTFPGYSFAYFLPVILHYELGYSQLKSQCLFLPPYVFGAVVSHLFERYVRNTANTWVVGDNFGVAC